MSETISPETAARDRPGVRPPSGRGAGFYATVSLRLGSLQPETVLASPPAGVRGFWQSGARWIAHAGSAAEINTRDRDGSASPGADVFVWTVREAKRILSEPWVYDLDGEARRPRFHGGFAFGLARTDPAGDPAGFWEPFPGGRFSLPAFEVEAGPDGATLTVTRRYPDDVARDRAIDELRRRADRTRERLQALERAGATPGAVPSATSIEEPVGPDEWRHGIERILSEISGGAARKVVLARSLDVTLAEVPDSASVLQALRGSNPLAHTYLIQFAADRFLLGAAPELIGRLEAGRFRTMAVAGSTPRGADPESDEWLGRQLLGSRKNVVEHEIVVEDIVEHLTNAGLEIAEIPEPELLRLPRIQHLRTELEATVPVGAHILELVRALHPTAAVCGYPRETAREILTEEEREPRGWYAGPVGWFDDRGEGEFAPALRSAVGRGPLLRLYAGCGIVEGSRPRAEWDETRVKLQTMLQALSVGRVP
ncbi:MAG: isochorismate synthase [Gemmatimonadota bacterium]|nr:isochorismate synthase [Gemmatimonadota bacterium]